jgi:transcriptional regulator with XRE-family HTH domain
MTHMAIGTKASEAGARETFMTLLRRHRVARGLTQTALARKLKIKSPSTVSLWESGVNFPHPDMVPKLARILGVDAMHLTKLIEPEAASHSSHQ